MATITYIEHDGTAHAVDVEEGITLMEGAVNNDVPGIEAQCGGGCSCATCRLGGSGLAGQAAGYGPHGAGHAEAGR